MDPNELPGPRVPSQPLPPGPPRQPLPPAMPVAPQTPPPPQQINPYEFIFSNQRNPKPLGGSNRRTYILVAVVGVVVVLLGLMIISLLSGGEDKGSLTTIVQHQVELARVADLGSKKSRSAGTQNFAANVSLTSSSAQKETVARIAASGKKVATKDLTLLKDPETDKTLDNAFQEGTYDQTLTEILQKELEECQTLLVERSKIATTAAEKDLLKKLHAQNALLLKSIAIQ